MLHFAVGQLWERQRTAQAWRSNGDGRWRGGREQCASPSPKLQRTMNNLDSLCGDEHGCRTSASCARLPRLGCRLQLCLSLADTACHSLSQHDGLEEFPQGLFRKRQVSLSSTIGMHCPRARTHTHAGPNVVSAICETDWWGWTTNPRACSAAQRNTKCVYPQCPTQRNCNDGPPRP